VAAAPKTTYSAVVSAKRSLKQPSMAQMPSDALPLPGNLERIQSEDFREGGDLQEKMNWERQQKAQDIKDRRPTALEEEEDGEEGA